MMRRVWPFLVLVLAGCPEDNPGGSVTADMMPMDRGIGEGGAGGVGGVGGMPDSDAGTGAGGVGGAGAMGGEGGVGGVGGVGGAAAGGAGGEGGLGGAGGEPPPPFEVDNCEDACRRYAECDRLGEIFGDEQTCLDQCTRLTRNDARPDRWWSCLGFEQCNLLQLCRVPEPEPLTCDEVCGQADECGVPLADCRASCADEANTDAFRRCGEPLLNGCGGVDAFVDCLGREVYTACNTTCERGVACNVVRADGCLLDCVTATADPDPLFSLRAGQRNQCVGIAPAEDCLAINTCFNPPLPGDEPVLDRIRLCQRWGVCGYEDFFGPCEEFLEFEADDAVALCIQTLTADQCPDFEALFECFDQGGGNQVRAGFCGRFCEAKQVCGLLEDSPLARPECVNGCVGGNNADPDGLERAGAELPCLAEDRCPDLTACIDAAGPAADCRAYCASLAGCGLAGPDCQAECDARWARDRQAATRACVAEAGDDCAAVAACAPPPAAPCEARCAREAECDREQPGCAGRCDDAHFANPDAELLLNACILSAPVCFSDRDGGQSVFTCQRAPDAGRLCLNYCRATLECGEREGELGECLRQCGRGFVDEAGLEFRVARDCLGGLPHPSACEDLQACLPPDLNADCPAFCDEAVGCGIMLTECEAACGDDPLARLRVLQTPDCMLESGLEDCAARTQCLVPQIELPPIDAAPLAPGRDEVCALMDACGVEEEFGAPCNDLFDEFGLRDTPETLSCLADQFGNGCPFDIFDAIFRCEGGGGGPVISPIIEECAALCEARSFCGDPDANDQNECRNRCEAQLPAGNADALVRLLPRMACARAWSCADLDDCLDASSPAATCAQHCARLVECGAIEDAAACADSCDDSFARRRQFAYRSCVADAAACEDVNACAVAPQVPCAEACAALDECGVGSGRCADVCDDRHFLDPIGQAFEVACAINADNCEAAVACLEEPDPAIAACEGYCWLASECVEGADRTLFECMNACSDGFRGAEALEFAAARACLGDVEPGADCAAALACLPEDVAIDCAAHCATLDACQIPTEGCLAACENGDVDLDTAGCVADSDRVGGCGRAAECVGFVPEPASAACMDYCATRADCDRAVDPYLCERACVPEPATLTARATCLNLSGCGELAECDAIDAANSAACLEACAGAAACNAFADDAVCAAICHGQDVSRVTPEGWPARLRECLGEAIDGPMCDNPEANRCLIPASCEGHDDLIIVGPEGGEFEVNTRGRADRYEARCGGQGPEAVLAIQVAGDGLLTATIADATYDPLIFMRREMCDDAAAEVACNDDTNGLLSEVSVRAQAGTYYLFIDGYDGDSGEATVRITLE